MSALGVLMGRPRAARDTDWFIEQLRAVSPGTGVALWLPAPTDATTNPLKPDGRVWTASATLQGRISYQGNGILVSFNGTSHTITTPDTLDLSFIEPTAMSIVALCNVTDTAGTRPAVTKFRSDSATSEWQMVFGAADKLEMYFRDSSASVSMFRVSDAAISQGAPHLFGMSYTGAGGATAANGITLYQDAAVIASTATNNASYVATENLGQVVTIGAYADGAAFFSGSMGFVAIFAANLSAAQHRRVADICREYYGLAL